MTFLQLPALQLKPLHGWQMMAVSSDMKHLTKMNTKYPEVQAGIYVCDFALGKQTKMLLNETS